MLFNSFIDELEKIAANTRALRRSVRKARATKHFGRRSKVEDFANWAPEMELPGAYILGPKKYRADTKKTLEYFDHLPEVRNASPEQRKEYKQQLEELLTFDKGEKKYLKDISGVYVNTDVLPDIAELYGGVTLKKKRDKKAFEAFAGAHEHAESKAKRKNVTPGVFSHAELGVVANDHNIIARLSGPGAKKAKKAAKAIRERDFELLRRVVRDRYGSRGEEFLRPDVKFPKAMKKDLQRSIRGNPKRFYEIVADLDA